MSEPAEVPWVPWVRMETICNCLRKRCKHKRATERRNADLDARQETAEALRPEDLRWLADIGWQA